MNRTKKRVIGIIFFENIGELCFIVLKRKGGPQQDPHSYGDQMWVRQMDHEKPGLS
jgi:hypothetical protein